MTVDKFMVQNVRYLTLESTYLQVQELLSKHKFRNFPLVDTEGTLSISFVLPTGENVARCLPFLIWLNNTGFTLFCRQYGSVRISQQMRVGKIDRQTVECGPYDSAIQETRNYQW